MPDFNSVEEQFFENLGFHSHDEKAHKRLVRSKLDQETGHPNMSSIENALQLLNSLNPDRWNDIMRSHN